MKRILGLFFIMLLLVQPAMGFEFPQPDWGALLQERTTMVKTPELELYTEGSPDSAWYYGAINEPRSGIYFGIVAENSDIIQPNPSAYLTYFELNNHQTDIYYPANEIIKNNNAVVTIGWNANNIDNIESYTDTIREGLDTLQSYGKPMFIRFANEMNVSSLGDDPDKYIHAFRVVADLVHQYEGFAMVWSPNDLGALDRPFDYYWPGNEYVDWVGVSSYMKRYFQGNPQTVENESIYFMTGDYAWPTNALKPVLEFMSRNGIEKPVMISEGGVANSLRDGTVLNEWAQERLRSMYYYLAMRYPQVKLINYFNVHRQQEAEYFDISDRPELSAILNEAYQCGAYITTPGESPKFTFVKAASYGVHSGAMPLYTYAYIPNSLHTNVQYFVDGALYASAQQIPYRVELSPFDFSEGLHTLEVVATGDNGQTQTKAYSFYNKGTNLLLKDAGLEISPEELPSQKPIRVIVQGQEVAFDVPPMIIQDRTLVPLRKFFNAVGVADENITYNNGQIQVQRGNETITMQEGQPWVQSSINGQYELDVPPMVIQGRTLVPLRFISENLGYSVTYEETETEAVIRMDIAANE